MLAKWTPELAAKVLGHLERIRNAPQSFPRWKVEVVKRTNGLPVYGDLGGVLALTLYGEFVEYNEEADTVAPVQENVWNDVALAYLGKQYPDLNELLPSRPEGAGVCPACSGCGWTLNGRLWCGVCRGLGWKEELDR